MKYYTMHNVCTITGVYDIGITYKDYLRFKRNYSEAIEQWRVLSIWDYIRTVLFYDA